MYTVTICALCLISILLVVFDFKLYKRKAFIFWLGISCIVGWVEFVCFLRHDAWIFHPAHVIGVKILGVTIEDILFCPCFSVIFYKLFHLTKSKFKQRVFNPNDKLIFAIIVGTIALVYYDLGSQFAKYMALRTALGFLGLVYCWNKISFRHSILFLTIVYIIGFGWDLPSVAGGVWLYIEDVLAIPKIYDGIYFTIFEARFPIELFGYYFTGGFFSFWMIAFLENYFNASTRNIAKPKRIYSRLR